MTQALVFLYVPGDRPERFDKAVWSGTDAVVLDLEDAVPLSGKDTARIAVGAWLENRDRDGVPVWVRVNPGAELLDDLTMAVRAGADGVWLPKVDDAATLERVDTMLAELEAEWGRPRTPVSPLIETGAGLCNAASIAAGPRVEFVQIGEVDLAADLVVTSVSATNCCGDARRWSPRRRPRGSVHRSARRRRSSTTRTASPTRPGG
ncbi:HpcH/HpaI aldolase/citrate lyase family protein [Gordonia sp. NPDC057258]|uniref:HpcH/HpaI aldolase/citrate lyase family protein n=1 Tax=unclassified Gordonia (in: high G+C Gram-positive bacteria) TaxID=2657482 RepID=UPI003641D1C5